MKFVVYQACLPPTNKNLEKNEILNRFPLGVAYLGLDEVVVHEKKNLIDADVAMIVGWVHDDSRDTPHLAFRKQIIEEQKRKNKKILLADSNLFLYKDKSNPFHYLRYSYNGIFPNTGDYCDKNIDPSRWISVSQHIGLALRDYRSNGNHILLCLQRNGGWSMGGYDVVDWTAQTIKELRKYTDREIVIRAHPGDKGSKNYLSANNLIKKIGLLKRIRLSKDNVDLMTDLKDCWAVVNHNSSPAVGAAIEGYPVFVTDSERSQCREIANTDLSKIENPELFDRQRWAERLAMFHWNFSEISNGKCWSHMRNYA